MRAFVVSLDFELHWGIRDHTPIARCRDRLLRTREVVPELLRTFANRGVNATWATVGMLFARERTELDQFMPAARPRYRNDTLSPYPLFAEPSSDAVGRGEKDDPFHFAGSLVDAIANTPGQELASHTFSHFYALEPGATEDTFAADMRAAQHIAESRHGRTLRSLVFPRNQENPRYRDTLASLGFTSYRTNPRTWFYRAEERETRARRAARLADAYVPIAQDGVAHATRDGSLTQIPSTTFLRPYSPRLRHLERLRIQRIVRAMRKAAEEDALFHLWWHPHNFGTHTRENLRVLDVILDELDSLRRSHGVESLTMEEVARRTAQAR